MPSRDSTGKPLSGAAKRRRAAAHLSLVPDDAAPPAPAALDIAPVPATIDQAVCWAATIQAKAAALARQGRDHPRVRGISMVVSAMGKLRLFARDSEDAVIVLQHHLGQVVDVRTEAPPEEPAGLCAWAFWQLAELLHQVATTLQEVDEAFVSHQARALAQLNHVRPQPRLDEIRRLVATETQ